MAASSLGVQAYFINNQYTTFEIPSTESYSLTIPGTNTTDLSTNTASLDNTLSSAVDGLLYVPALTDSGCTNLSAPYVPANTTSEIDLPGSVLPRIAIAPWTSISCVQAYLSQGRADLVQAFIFFLPDQGSAVPPPANSLDWSLYDGGQWKSDNGYPVWAVSSTVGASLTSALALYSGNISTTPNSQYIVSQHGSQGLVRLAITVDLENSSSLPSLWIFLVIILAILVALVAIISLIMHIVQRRRRNSLRRRVANGEVDLEMLGVKRLLVPREVLDKMPVYTFESPGPITTVYEEGEIDTPVVSSNSTSDLKASPHTTARTLSTSNNHFDQPGCAICLDDFIPAESQVRELPCNHIYHPECVDNFLTQNSSLCPLCKKSSLPPGYCPTVITAAMVRRERLLRRARQRAQRRGTPGDLNAGLDEHRLSNLMSRRHGRTGSSTSQSNAARPPTESTSTSQPSQQDRQEWIRRRIDTIVGQTDTDAQDPEQEERQQPLWRRAWRHVFPHG